MLITEDVHDIARRLKEIDSAYSLHFNPRASRFELHGAGDELLITYPYDRMDERMVTHARRTRRERLSALIAEIEAANAAAEARENRARDTRVEDIVREGADRYYVDRCRKGDY